MLEKNKIALAGLPGVGKDTISKLIFIHPDIIKNFSGKIYHFAFADEIKTYISFILARPKNIEFFDLIQNSLFGESKLRNNIIPNFSVDNKISFRDLLNDLGEFFRKYHPNYWINIILDRIKQIEKISELKGFFLISDLRRENEYKALKENGFFLVRVKRPSSMIFDKINLTELNSYSDDKFDFIINNDGTEEDLKKKINKFVEFLLHN